MEIETKTVKQIASELGTNKNVIYRIIQKNNLRPIPEETNEQGRKNATRYTLGDFAIIKTEFIKLQETKKDTPEPSRDNENINSRLDLQSLIESQRERIESLERELETSRASEKDLRDLLSKQMEQLFESQRQNKQLQTIIEQEQKIRAIQTLAIETKNKPKLLERFTSLFKPNRAAESSENESPEE